MKKLKNISKQASEKAISETNVKKANELIRDIFTNKHFYLDAKKIFEPNYFHCTLKEKFYKNGGNEFKEYDEKEYSKLLDVPTEYILEVVNNTPEFFLWLHEKRNLDEEMDILVSIASRKLVNGMSNASTKDQAQALNALSKFSTLVKPEKKSDPYDDFVDNIMELDVLNQQLEELGYRQDEEILMEVSELDEDIE